MRRHLVEPLEELPQGIVPLLQLLDGLLLLKDVQVDLSDPLVDLESEGSLLGLVALVLRLLQQVNVVLLIEVAFQLHLTGLLFQSVLLLDDVLHLG